MTMKKLTLLTLLCLLIFSKSFAQRINYVEDSLLKKSALKVEFFSPLTGNLTLGYERYINNFTGIEAKIGIIGIGTQPAYEASGVFLKVGPKFKLKPTYAVDGTFGTHLLRGSYIRPEIAISTFQMKDQFEPWNNPTNDERQVFSGALLINYGHQYVLGRVMTLDWHVGMGYAFTNHEDQVYYFGYSGGTSEFPIAFSAGFTVGILLR